MVRTQKSILKQTGRFQILCMEKHRGTLSFVAIKRLPEIYLFLRFFVVIGSRDIISFPVCVTIALDISTQVI